MTQNPITRKPASCVIELCFRLAYMSYYFPLDFIYSYSPRSSSGSENIKLPSPTGKSPTSPSQVVSLGRHFPLTGTKKKQIRLIQSSARIWIREQYSRWKSVVKRNLTGVSPGFQFHYFTIQSRCAPELGFVRTPHKLFFCRHTLR